jgi:uncharacterized phiE125 gp8 family phage protein
MSLTVDVVRIAPVRVEGPTLQVFDVQGAKDHCRISGTAEDAQIQRWIEAATQKVEDDTNCKLLTQTWDLALDAFPVGSDALRLPFGPLQSVTHVKYTDSNGVLQTLGASSYLVDTSAIPGRIGLADDGTWPSDLRIVQPGTVRAVFGWSAAHLVPLPLAQAVALQIAWFSEVRQPLETDWAAYDRLIAPYVIRGVA